MAKDANFHKLLDRSVQNLEFLQPDDACLTELSPDDAASLREEGAAAADVMWAATASAVEETIASKDPGVRVYVSTRPEVATLAMQEEMVV